MSRQPSPSQPATFQVVVMGVSGCGKSSVGALLAHELGGTFVDGDDLHPQSNIDKMAAGTPLNDADREPWLRDIGARLGEAADSGRTLIIGCSALKRSYRELIQSGSPDTVFVHLHGTPELLAARVGGREGHFMPTGLLESQLATLELLESDEPGREFDIADPAAEIAAAAAAWVRSVRN